MLKFYNTQMRIEPEKIKNGKQISKGLRLLKKNSPIYKFAKKTWRLYGGFYQIEILIPKDLYTTSLNSSDKNKILKVTKDNHKEYEELKKKYTFKNLYKVLNKKNIIGIDLTDKMFLNDWQSGVILWNIPNEIKIGKPEKILLKAKKLV